MKDISLQQLAGLCGAISVRYANSDPTGKLRVSQLTTDSRAVSDVGRTVFAAMRTAVGDGHKYIADLAARGVRAFIVERIPEDAVSADATFIVVPDVAEALRKLVASLPVDARGGVLVTGSVGKTKTKELLYRALKPHAAVERSPRSWNSALGLVLSMWEYAFAKSSPQFLITEAGIDAPGQGERIAALTGRTHAVGVITPLTDEHDDAFASHAAKVAEKLAVVSQCRTIVISDGDPELLRQAEAIGRDADKKIVVVHAGENVLHRLAEAALKELEAGDSPLETLRSLKTVEVRRRISTGVFGNTIVRDAFTPDLRSLADSIDFFRRHCKSRRPKVLIYGELEESKEMSADTLRRRVNGIARRGGIRRVVNAADATAPSLANVESGNVWRDMDILIFGENGSSITPYERALAGADHDTTLDVDLDALVHNYNYYRRLLPAGTGMVAMVKASAYGMGAVEIAKTLQDTGAAYLAVAVIEEGVQLRTAGITMPIMVLNPITNRYPALFANRLEPAVFSLGELDRLIAEAEAYGANDYPIHIKLDTGMHRVGFLEKQLPGIVERLQATDSVRVASILSHLATADCLDKDAYTNSQITAFVRMTDYLRSMLPAPIRRHLLNTAGMMRFADSCQYEMARLGIGLYGIAPFETDASAKLRPVAALNTHIISIKHWEADTPIGYGGRGRTLRPSVIATIPVGYADGINRHLGNGAARFIVNGVECPTIGNICMDQCMIDVTDAPGAAVGTKVEIFGNEAPVERLAATLGTIPYEILTSVGSRARRVYIRR